jgi:drug/metabolite transporter (DMT)-like permease
LDWVLLSILSAAAFGLVNITDKLLISHYMPGFRSFAVWVGIVTFAVGLLLVLSVPASREVNLSQVVVASGAGLIWGLGLGFLFLSIRSQEVSRAISVYYIHPIFVAVMASVFLGENLNALQWGAVVVTVAGAISITVHGIPGTRRFELNSSIRLLMVAAALTACAQLISKHALEGTDIWHFYPYWYMGLAVPFLVLLNPSALREIRGCLSKPIIAVWMVGGEAILGSLAAWLMLSAIQAGPVSLVIAIAGTRPIFVFLIGTFLSLRWWKLLNEPIHRDILMQKAFSILMIVIGVAIISTA